MRCLLAFCLLTPVSCLLAAIEGTVINGTTGKPQPSVTVSLVQPGANGMQAIASSTSDATGKFSIDHDLPPPPALLQADYKGVTYTQVQPPGRPTTGIQFQIYESAAKAAAGDADGASHHDRAQRHRARNQRDVPDPQRIQHHVSGFLQRDGAILSAQGRGRQSGRERDAAHADDHPAAAVKAAKPGSFKIDYPVRPGETRFDMHYTLPASESFLGESRSTASAPP